MLGKLLKHEWKSIWKIPTILLGALMGLAVLAGFGFASPVWDSSLDGLGVLAVLTWMLFYLAVLGVSLGIMLYLAVRFYRSMFTDEGYLTHTLPATSRQLLLSKVLIMAAWIFLSMVGVFASILIVGGMAFFFLLRQELSWNEFGELLSYVWQMIHSNVGIQFTSFLAGIFFMLAAGIVYGTMIIAGSISIGQMVHKHKVLGSIGAYFAINTVVQIVSMVIVMPMMFYNMYNGTENVFAILAPTYWIMGALECALAVGLYFLSEYLIRKQLNLD
ncbi:MAG: hypothetical protein HFI46_01360 [Lachnospiraceae bacterium]|jgi:hypothetical protein|nr:hypothetical protein [Lachnospiraceae bacterium]